MVPICVSVIRFPLIGILLVTAGVLDVDRALWVSGGEVRELEWRRNEVLFFFVFFFFRFFFSSIGGNGCT